MTLLLQVLGVMLLAWALAGVRRREAAAVLAGVIAIAVSGYFVITNATSSGKGLRALHGQFGALTPDQKRASGGAIFASNDAFLQWVSDRVPSQATVRLDCGRPSACAGGLNEWITWRLTPRRFVDDPSKADWTIRYGTPARPGTPTAGVTQFQPGFELEARG